MLIPSFRSSLPRLKTSLSRRVNANSQLPQQPAALEDKLIKKGEC